MKKIDVMLWVRFRADKKISIESRHEEFIRAMVKIGPPLGFSDITPPVTPECGTNLNAKLVAKLSTKGIRFSGYYLYRGDKYKYEDSSKFDDVIYYGFSAGNGSIDYSSLLRDDFPKVVEAFQGYSAIVSYGQYDLAYTSGVEPSDDGESFFDANGNEVRNNAVYNLLTADERIDVEGRNNIYILRPAQYWDEELCNRALGYGVDEVINRLKGTNAEVRRLMNGVYIVLDVNPNLKYAEFLKINAEYKLLLGLV